MAFGSGGFGSAPFGGTEFGGSSITIEGLSEPVVDNDGGTVLSATALGLAPGFYTLHVGPLGTTSDPIAYGAISGNGQLVEIDIDGAFIFAVPPLPIGGPYKLTYVDSLDVVTTSSPVLEVVARNFHVKRHDYARLFPPKWLSGPRGILNEGYPQV